MRIAPAQLLGLDLGSAVVVPQPELLSQRFLLGVLPTADLQPAIDVDRADVQDPPDALLGSGLEDVCRALEDELLKQLPATPVADLGGAVIDNVGSGEGMAKRGHV